MEFRRAESAELDRVRGFYWALIDLMEGGEFDPGWRKGVYPSDAELRKSMDAGELYVLEDEGAIAAAVIINNEYNPSYEGLPWRVDAPPERVFMLHTLGVAPAMQGRGVTKRVVAECLATAREKGAECVRLDVLGGNEPAEKLYLAMGFYFVEAKTMYYEDTGWTEFRMFEYKL